MGSDPTLTAVGSGPLWIPPMGSDPSGGGLWTGEFDPGFYDRVTVDAISLGAGSTLSGVNGHAFTTAALSGAGTVAGDLTLESGGAITVAAGADGAIAGTTVTGTLTLSGSLRVVVGGDVKPEPGVYRICSAQTLAGAGGISVVPFPGDTQFYKVKVDSEGIVLMIVKSGLRIILK